MTYIEEREILKWIKMYTIIESVVLVVHSFASLHDVKCTMYRLPSCKLSLENVYSRKLPGI